MVNAGSDEKDEASFRISRRSSLVSGVGFGASSILEPWQCYCYSRTKRRCTFQFERNIPIRGDG